MDDVADLVGRCVRLTPDTDRALVDYSTRTAMILSRNEPPSASSKEEWTAKLNRSLIVLFPRPRVIRRIMIRYNKKMEDSLALTFTGRQIGHSETSASWRQTYAWIYGIKAPPRQVRRLFDKDLIELGPADVVPC